MASLSSTMRILRGVRWIRLFPTRLPEARQGLADRQRQIEPERRSLRQAAFDRMSLPIRPTMLT